MLAKLASDPGGWRCLALRPRQAFTLSSPQIQALTDSFQVFLRGLPGGVFFGAQGHIWAIYKNELSPGLAAQMLQMLRGYFADDDHPIETIQQFDLKASLSALLIEIDAIIQQQPRPDDNKLQTAERLKAVVQEIPQAAKQLAHTRSNRRENVVLVVEDDPFYTRLIDKVLAGQARVVTAMQADEVIEEYLITAPDIVLMDIGLPDTSGHELLKTILAMDPQAYIVMASGNSFRDDVVGAMTSGAKGFITKPFSRDKIIKAINQAPTIKRSMI